MQRRRRWRNNRQGEGVNGIPLLKIEKWDTRPSFYFPGLYETRGTHSSLRSQIWATRHPAYIRKKEGIIPAGRMIPDCGQPIVSVPSLLPWLPIAMHDHCLRPIAL